MSTVATAVFDRSAALERVDGEASFLHELMRVFLEDCPETLETARNALAKGDAATLARAAHTVKGSAANFAAGPAVAAARQLEQVAAAGNLAAAPQALELLEAELERLFASLHDELAALPD